MWALVPFLSLDRLLNFDDTIPLEERYKILHSYAEVMFKTIDEFTFIEGFLSEAQTATTQGEYQLEYLDKEMSKQIDSIREETEQLKAKYKARANEQK